MLGLACCHLGFSAWASAEVHITPQHMSTNVEQCICHGFIGICFIKVPVNGQEPYLGKRAQHFK